MKNSILAVLIATPLFCLSQTEELKKQLYETGKAVLKKQVTNALTDQLGSQAGQLGGAAVTTIFNAIDKQAQKSKVRDQISDANNQLIHLKIAAHSGDINRLRISPDSRYLITAGDDNTVLITRLSDGQTIKEIETDKDVLDIKFHPTKNWMALGMSGQIDIWDLSDLTLLQSVELEGPEGLAPLSESASLIYFHPTVLSQIIYFNPKKTFSCYDFLTGELIYNANVKAPSTAVNALKATYNIYQSMGRTQGFLKSWFPTPDGKHIVVQTRKSTYLWDPYTETEVIEYQKNKGSKDYVGIPYLILNSELFTSSEDDIIIYDVTNGNITKQSNLPIATTLGQAHEKKIIFSPDKEYFMVAGSDTLKDQKILSLDFYQTESLTKIISFPGDIQNFREHYYYDWSNNGKYIVKYCASCKDESVVVYDMELFEDEADVEPSAQVEIKEEKKDKYDELRELKKLLDEEVLTQEEFDAQKKKILERQN